MMGGPCCVCRSKASSKSTSRSMEPASAHASEGAATTEHATETTTAADEGAATADAAPEAVPATDAGADAATDETHAAVAPKGAVLMLEERGILHAAHEAPTLVKLSPFIAMVLGFLLAFQFYIRKPYLPAQLASQQRPLYLFLLNKWYFDELYDWVIIRPAKAIGKFLWQKGDGAVIDGTINGIAMGIIPFFTRLSGRAQSGYIFTYAFAMVLGIAVLITWMTLGGH